VVRRIYHQGWTAVTRHRTAWRADQPPPFDADVWELYGPEDWTQAKDIAAENPEKLAKLQRLWLIEAVKYNFAEADQPIPAGKHQVRMEFTYDGGGLAKGGDVTLYYDGKSVGKGRVDKTQPMGYSADEACDMGADTGSAGSPDDGPRGNTFSGEIHWVQIDIGTDDHDHLVSPEERFRVAMARQ
jgi:arylsulfatase